MDCLLCANTDKSIQCKEKVVQGKGGPSLGLLYLKNNTQSYQTPILNSYNKTIIMPKLMN